MAWTHARYAQQNDNGATGDLIPNAINRVGLLSATVHSAGPWSAGIQTRYVGAYPLAQDGSLTGPPSIVTNLRARRELTSNAAVSFDLLNVFNRQYFDIAYQQDFQVSPTAPTVPSGITVHPGEPRQIRVTLSLKY